VSRLLPGCFPASRRLSPGFAPENDALRTVASLSVSQRGITRGTLSRASGVLSVEIEYLLINRR
jgi:hypothetical protein